MRYRHVRIIDGILAIVTVGVFSYALVVPRSPIRERLERWQHERRVRALVQRAWAELTAGDLVTPNAEEVDLVLITNYTCTYCRQAHEVLGEFLVANPDVGVAILQHPFEGDQKSESAARAAVCAAQAGRFAAMNDLLLTTTEWRETMNWSRVAGRSGIHNVQAFMTCLTSSVTEARIRNDIRLSTALDVFVTPTFLSRYAIRTGVPETHDIYRMLGKHHE